MPGLSGTELTALIRAQEAFLHTPIVFLTGDPDPETQFEVLECGADDFLQQAHPPAPPGRGGAEPGQARARASASSASIDASRQRRHRPADPPAPAAPARRRTCRRQRAAACSSSRSKARPACASATATPRMEQLMTEAGRRLGVLAGSHPGGAAQRQCVPGVLPRTASRRNWKTRRARCATAFGRHPIDIDGDSLQRLRAGGRLRRAAAWLRRCRRRARGGRAGRARRRAATPVGLRAYVPPRAQRRRPATWPTHMRGALRRRALRTDLPADRRRRRRRRGAVPGAAAACATPTARCTTPRRSCRPRKAPG